MIDERSAAPSGPPQFAPAQEGFRDRKSVV